MRGNGCVIGFGHARDKARLKNAPRVRQVGLHDGTRAFFQQIAEPPLGKNALARRNGQMGLAGEFDHPLHILALNRLFDKHRLVRLEGLDEHRRSLRGNRAVKVDGNVEIRAPGSAHRSKGLDRVVDKGRIFDNARRPDFGRSRS